MKGRPRPRPSARSTPLSFQDRFILQGLIAAVLGPDCSGRLDELSGNRLLLTADIQSNLSEVAELLSVRMWEREASDEDEQAVDKMHAMQEL